MFSLRRYWILVHVLCLASWGYSQQVQVTNNSALEANPQEMGPQPLSQNIPTDPSSINTETKIDKPINFEKNKHCSNERIEYELSIVKKLTNFMKQEYCGLGIVGNILDSNLKCHTVAARIASYLINTVQPCCVQIRMMGKDTDTPLSHVLVGVFVPQYKGGTPDAEDWLLSIDGWEHCPPKIAMGQAKGFDQEVVFEDKEIANVMAPARPSAEYCTEAVKITSSSCIAYSIEFVPLCSQGNAFANACSTLGGKLNFSDWASKRGMGCACGNRFETLYLSNYLNSKSVDIDKFKSDCQNIIKITNREGDPCKRCETAGGTIDDCGNNRSNSLDGCFCKKFEGGNEYHCMLDEAFRSFPLYLYKSCNSVDTASTKCRKLPITMPPNPSLFPSQ